MENTITRIDFAIAGELVIVNKLTELPERAIVLETAQYPVAKLDEMLAWCEAHDWEVRRFSPLGARAWKGEKRPVRTAARIKRMRDELTARQVAGLNVHTLDLLFDC